MADKTFDLANYVTVPERLAAFYELYASGRIVTEAVEILTAPDGVQRVMVKALAYRTVDDPLPAVGHSWMALPGLTSFTKGSELENAETSAVGRAIGFLGILVDKGLATSQEIASKQDDRSSSGAAAAPPAAAPDPKPEETETLLGPITRSGVIVKGSGRNSDLEWRETPNGFHIGFLLEVGDGKPRPQVVIEGELAVAFFAAANMAGPALAGERIEVEGDVYEVRVPKRNMIYRIRASRVVFGDYIIPADIAPGQAELALA